MSTHPLMFPSTSSGRLFLLVFPLLLEPLLSHRCPPFPLNALTLIFLGAALAHIGSLPPHDLVLWTDGSVPFPFGKNGSGILANCSLCGTEDTLFFSASRVCSSFSVKACAILQALCWSRQHQKVCHFSSLLLLHGLYKIYLNLSGRNCLLSPPVLSVYNESPDTRFSRETTRLMSWPDGERYLRPL